MTQRPRIALLIETSNVYARELLRGIRNYIREHQPWSISLTERGRSEPLPGWLRTWKGDGLIARLENRAMAEAVKSTGLPAVDVSFGLELPLFPRVITDSRAATRLAAGHLLERGFEHFGYCGDPRYHWSNLRSRFFSDHLRQAGRACHIFGSDLSPSESARSGGRPPVQTRRRESRPPDSWEAEVDAIGNWLASLPKPVGVMACYDIRGQQVLEACRRHDLHVPEAVAVIGVHNDELLCDLCDPPLSSVIPNARRAGHEAAALLDRMLHGEKLPPMQVLIEPIGVATRQSTDVVAVGDPKVAAAVRFMREHAGERIDVSDVLKAVPISRSSLERRFKELLSRTPHEQIIQVKIERVKSLLATTDLPLAVIAERTGFEHIEYMSVAFKRATGVAPSEYRARNKA
jgi:LacI family transcriptional regulator